MAQHRFAEWEKVFHQAVEADLAHLGDSFSITSLPPKSANKVRKVSMKMKKPSGAKAILGKRRPASKRPAASQKFNPKKQRKTKSPMNFYKKYKYVVEIDESHLNKQRSGALTKSARIQPDQVWVWEATVPGQPDRFVFRVLEHAKDAYDGKPRGQNEILQCLRILNLKPKTILVTVGWKATIAAVKQLKLEMKWTDADLWHEIVNHSAGEITNANGFTTNHIENRWSLVKRWARKRGGGRLPSHSDRKRWTCLLNEYRWRKLQASRKAQGNKHVYVVPLTATLNALQYPCAPPCALSVCFPLVCHADTAPDEVGCGRLSEQEKQHHTGGGRWFGPNATNRCRPAIRRMCAVATASQPPDAAHVQEQILTGGFSIHSDRCGITKKSIQVQMGTTRRNLVSKGLLAPDRTWSTLCQTELLKWLNSPKDGRSRKMVPPASASSVAAAAPPALPALDHMRKSSSSSSSTSDD